MPLPEPIFFGGYEAHVDGPRRLVENPNIYTFEVNNTECAHRYDVIVKQRCEKILAETHYETYTISSYVTMGMTSFGKSQIRIYRAEFAGDNNLEPIRKPGDCTGTWDEIKDCF